MPTFKAVIQPHQERKDGKFPVSIRVTHNRRSFYVPTGLYVAKNQIQKKSFDIKDNLVLMRVGKTITDFEKALLGLDTQTLMQMTGKDLKDYLLSKNQSIDFYAFCDELIKKDTKKYDRLRMAINILKEMGITSLTTSEVTLHLLMRMKEAMDAKNLANRTKNTYLFMIANAFRLCKKAYNTEFNTVIQHDPFDRLQYYHVETSERRAMSVEDLRSFFNCKPKEPRQVMARDIARLSFCLCGINVADLLVLRKEDWDKKSNRINYKRKKTKGRRPDGAFSSIRIEPEVQEAFHKWLAPASSPLLFDFMGLNPNSRNSVGHITCKIEQMCEEYGLKRVTTYWFRHTWATIARNNCHVSKDDVDLCLNHVGNNKMADVYIKPDWSLIDEANRKVLDFVFQK